MVMSNTKRLERMTKHENLTFVLIRTTTLKRKHCTEINIKKPPIQFSILLALATPDIILLSSMQLQRGRLSRPLPCFCLHLQKIN